MALYDTVTLILEGTDGTGAPVRYEANRQVGTVAPLILSVVQTEILAFADGQMDVYYLVEPFSQRDRAFVRALQAQASAHLPLSVRRASAEQPLPAPTVSANGSAIENGGFLDPAAEECTALASYPNIVKGDEITYRWVGIVSTRMQSYKVADPTKPPADYADRDFIVTNTGDKVVVSYSVRRGGVGSAVPSETLEFRIDTAAPFAIDSTPVDLTGTQSYTRHATGGVRPYTYSSSDPTVVSVPDSHDGRIQAVTAGTTTISVHDSAQGQGSYPVKVAGTALTQDFTTETHYLFDYQEAVTLSTMTVTNTGGNVAFNSGLEVGTPIVVQYPVGGEARLDLKKPCKSVFIEGYAYPASGERLLVKFYGVGDDGADGDLLYTAEYFRTVGEHILLTYDASGTSRVARIDLIAPDEDDRIFIQKIESTP
jgi:hypothetical protein